MHLENEIAHYQRLLYITIIFMVQLLFSEAWEVPGCGRIKVSHVFNLPHIVGGRANILTRKTRIVGGSSHKISKVPWQVLLRLDGQKTCGGSIIQPRWVLTAAHCLVFNGTFYDIEVFAGINNRSELKSGTGQRPKIKDVFIHGDSNGRKYDIALVQLETPLEFNDNVGAICQPRDDERLPSHAIATGWGKTVGGARSRKSDASHTLQMVELTLKSSHGCRRFYKIDVDRIICAGSRVLSEAKMKSTCYGDSGGPLAVNVIREGHPVWVLVGITSAGLKRGCGFIPDIFTRVTSFEKWIDCKISNCTDTEEENYVPNTTLNTDEKYIINGSPSLYRALGLHTFGGIVIARHLVLVVPILVVS